MSWKESPCIDPPEGRETWRQGTALAAPHGIGRKFDDVKQKIIEVAKQLGQDPFTPSRDLKGAFKESPLVRDYLYLKEQREDAAQLGEIELQVFNVTMFMKR